MLDLSRDNLNLSRDNSQFIARYKNVSSVSSMDHRRFSHSIPLRIGNFDWWLRWIRSRKSQTLESLSDVRLQTAKDSPWHSSKQCSWVDVSATLRGVIQPSSTEHFKLWLSAFSPFFSAQEVTFWLMTSLNQRPQNVNYTRFETS